MGNSSQGFCPFGNLKSNSVSNVVFLFYNNTEAHSYTATEYNYSVNYKMFDVQEKNDRNVLLATAYNTHDTKFFLDILL